MNVHGPIFVHRDTANGIEHILGALAVICSEKRRKERSKTPQTLIRQGFVCGVHGHDGSPQSFCPFNGERFRQMKSECVYTRIRISLVMNPDRFDWNGDAVYF